MWISIDWPCLAFKVHVLLVNYSIALTKALEQWICLFKVEHFHLFSMRAMREMWVKMDSKNKAAVL